MKTDVEIIDDVFSHLKDTGIKSSISGDIHKWKRPMESVNEDIVISVLANANGQKQEAFVNVNLYVPDIKRKTQFEPDTTRLRTLCKTCEAALESVHGKGYRLTLAEQRVIDVSDLHEHMINNKLLYQIINE